MYYTPLLDLQTEFDVVWDMPPEEFHLIKEGVTKQILYRMFVNRESTTALGLLAALNQAYKNLQIFTETPRKPRNIDVLRMKGSEFGTIGMSVFPVLFKDLMKVSAMKIRRLGKTERKHWYDMCGWMLCNIITMVFFSGKTCGMQLPSTHF